MENQFLISFDETNTISSPSSKFFIGDLSYVLDSQDKYHLVLEQDGGKVSIQKDGQNHAVIFHNTRFGDGEYNYSFSPLFPSSDKLLVEGDKLISVDSGTIGICPIELVNSSISTDELLSFGVVLTLPFPNAAVSYLLEKNGVNVEIEDCLECDSSENDCSYCHGKGYTSHEHQCYWHDFYIHIDDHKTVLMRVSS